MDAALQMLLDVAVRTRGASYSNARDAIVDSAPSALDEMATVLRTMLADSSWETRLTAEALLGWIVDRPLWITVSTYAKGEVPPPIPVQGATPSVRGGAIMGLGPRAMPRLLELVYKAPPPSDQNELGALFAALVSLAD